MSVGHDVSTRDGVLEATQAILENDLILCAQGRRAYGEAVLRELGRAQELEDDQAVLGSDLRDAQGEVEALEVECRDATAALRRIARAHATAEHLQKIAREALEGHAEAT